MSLTEITSVLKSGGPWAIIAILLLAVVFLVKYTIRLVDERDAREQKRNAELLALLEKRIEADVKHEQAFRNMARAFERMADKL